MKHDRSSSLMGKSVRLKLVLALAASLSACSYSNGTSDEVAGWTSNERSLWYQSTQGSRLIPMTWFEALERFDDQDSFSDKQYLSETFGFVAPPAEMDMALPIGFTKDRQSDSHLKVTKLRWYMDQPSQADTAEPWLGLNCSACHTGNIDYQDHSLIIDGAPSLLDFQTFVAELDKTVLATRNTADKWDRFAAKVLDGKDTAANRSMLETSVDQFLDWQLLTEEMNKSNISYGYGRLDAVGHILNKVLMFTGSTGNEGNASNAPVSYPFLWNIWRQERVQWNGVAMNSRFKLPGDEFEYGALGRNAGEVLGVFGDVDIQPDSGVLGQLNGYASSVRPENLTSLEVQLQRLKPPRWPEFLPPVNNTLAKQGSSLFKQKCASCHLPEEAWEADKPTERMISFFDTVKNSPKDLTDIWMACNAYLYDGKTGPLEGQKNNDGVIFAERAPAAEMLAASVKGTLLGKKKELVKVGFRNFFGIQRPPVIDQAEDPFAEPRANERALCLETEGQIVLGYKARPLDGIWATPPFLHNGSVSSLYELLLPASERTQSYWVGSSEYDPVNVGYITTKPAEGMGFEFLTRTPSGKIIPGNDNSGHEYGAANFTEDERRSLVEYMKTI